MEPGTRDMGDGTSTTRSLALGLLLAAVTVLVAVILPAQLADVLVALLLALAAGVYPGFAMLGENGRQRVLQWIVAIVFAAIALGGIGWWRPLLAIGWLLHAGWDLLHHMTVVRTDTHPDYPMLCLAYDLGIAAFVLAT